MLEVKIIRSDNKYDVTVNNEKIVHGIRTHTYFTEKFNFFNYSNPSPLASCVARKSFFSPTKRRIFFDQLKTEYEISRGWAYYSLEVYDSLYSIRYGLFKLKGFFLNDKKVGEIEIIKAGLLSYEKRIVFLNRLKIIYPSYFCLFPLTIMILINYPSRILHVAKSGNNSWTERRKKSSSGATAACNKAILYSINRQFVIARPRT